MSKQVSLDSRYGIKPPPPPPPMQLSLLSPFRALPPANPLPPPFYSVSAVITFLSTSKLLLISMLSLACYPVVPVRPCFSLPARSTSCSLLTVIDSPACLRSYCSTVRVKIVCEREDKSFKLWEARTLFFEPKRNNSIASSGV